MTDKQIIIDGVDIAGCEFAVKPINDNKIKCHCAKGLLQIAKMQEQPESIKSGLCENNHNCYYKQLKRTESELVRKEQECKQAKQNAQDTYDLWQALIESFNILQGEKIKLEQECEELKEENAKARMEICNQCGRRDDYNIPCKQIRDLDYDFQLEIEENEKLKQTLIDIKGIVEENFYFLDCDYRWILEQILQKISECEVEDDNA